jgi:hypothetical protein
MQKIDKPSWVGALFSKDKREQRDAALAKEEELKREAELEKQAADFANQYSKEQNAADASQKAKDEKSNWDWLNQLGKYGLDFTNEEGKFDLGASIKTIGNVQKTVQDVQGLIEGPQRTQAGGQPRTGTQQDQPSRTPLTPPGADNRSDSGSDQASTIIYWVIGGVVAVGLIGIIIVLATKK